MASNSLRGHGGQRHIVYNLRANELRLHVKLQPPRFTDLAMHRTFTEVQTKRGLTNICLDTSDTLAGSNDSSVFAIKFNYEISKPKEFLATFQWLRIQDKVEINFKSSFPICKVFPPIYSFFVRLFIN